MEGAQTDIEGKGFREAVVELVRLAACELPADVEEALGQARAEEEPGSTAEQAGLRAARMAPDGTFVAGDIIVGLDGRAVTGVGELLGRLDDYKVGDTVRLQVRRDGGKVELPVTLQPGS